MNNLTINTSAGTLLINDTIVAPLSEDLFRKLCIQHHIIFSERIPMETRVNIGIATSILNKNFGLVLSYSKGELESVWMTWLDGISAKKGYDTTEAELISDLRKLRSFLVHYFDKSPEEETYNHSVFDYFWGRCSCSASLQLQSVGIGIRWKKNLRT